VIQDLERQKSIFK